MLTIQTVAQAWQEYLKTIQNWQDLTTNITPLQDTCGIIYEIPNPINRPNESFAIVDMSTIALAPPHYHTGGEYEIYIVLQGNGTLVVGSQEHQIEKGSVVITPPETTHYTLPKNNLVLAVINTPPFNPRNMVYVNHTNPTVKFDKTQYYRLIGSHNHTKQHAV
ncbi:MAG: cupin domain-containing protein [Epsilonproteobacteria bacterium]|nr:cupin domain-containing protein [Campylobacterota bacterium]